MTGIDINLWLVPHCETCHAFIIIIIFVQYSLCNEPLIELSNPGASGSIFYVTRDDEFIIKTVQHKEAEFLQKLLPGYYMVSLLPVRKPFNPLLTHVYNHIIGFAVLHLMCRTCDLNPTSHLTMPKRNGRSVCLSWMSPKCKSWYAKNQHQRGFVVVLPFVSFRTISRSIPDVQTPSSQVGVESIEVNAEWVAWNESAYTRTQRCRLIRAWSRDSLRRITTTLAVQSLHVRCFSTEDTRHANLLLGKKWSTLLWRLKCNED